MEERAPVAHRRRACSTFIALGLGARLPETLVLLFTAFFAADMNLRAVIRKAKNGKFAGAGGYLAHVGVGIMLSGIVISGAYAKSQRLTLPVNVPKKTGDTTLTFLRVVPGTADRQAGDGGPGRDADGQELLRLPEDVREQPHGPAHGQSRHPQLAPCSTSTSPRSSTIRASPSPTDAISA